MMPGHNAIKGLLLLPSLILLLTADTWRLVVGDDLPAWDFNFSNPGARTNGMGGTKATFVIDPSSKLKGIFR